MDESRAHSQEIRPLKICVLNLMPLKITTETDLVRLLSNTPLQLEVYFMKLKSHTPKNTPIEHMMMFYKDFYELSKQKFDGMIVTGAPIETMEYEDVQYWDEITEIFDGAPVETMDFEQVDYWPELCEIMDFSETNVYSTLHVCWGAQAGLYHFYGVPKYQLDKKMFGIFPQKPLDPSQPIFRGFDDIFYMPHSRHTEVRREDIEKVPGLDIIAESPESGVSIVMARGGREFFVTGHLEYAPNTLDKEYKRDMGKRDDVELPKNYYYNDDPNEAPLVTWRAHANLFYSNWINYYVYQETPYNIDDIK